MLTLKRTLVFVAMLCAVLAVAGAGAKSVPGESTACKQCGMDRDRFSHSRMLIKYHDGSIAQVCSIHCSAVELLRSGDKRIRDIMVADYFTGELIDARTAVWVIGGARRGVMTVLPKWAFVVKEDAQRFLSEQGGFIGTFEEAMSVAVNEVRTLAEEERAVRQQVMNE